MSNPWSDFERNIPERGFTPASTGARDPEADSQEPQSPQELFDSLISPPARDTEHAPSFDTFVMSESPAPERNIPEWGVPSSEDDTGIPGVTFSNNPDAPRPKGRIVLISALAAGALAICAVATIVGVNFLSNAGTNPTEAATEETTEPAAPPPPEAPISALSLDVKKDLAFAADIPASATSLKNVSVALDDNPEWTREESTGVTTYRNVNGCVVNWSQKDQTFPAGVTDFEASHEALYEVTQDRNFMVTEYGYWTPNSTDRAGKTEVVESRVDQDGKAVVVAARASVATGEVGLIWMSCEDPSKLSRFASDVRFDVGFILDGLKP